MYTNSQDLSILVSNTLPCKNLWKHGWGDGVADRSHRGGMWPMGGGRRIVWLHGASRLAQVGQVKEEVPISWETALACRVCGAELLESARAVERPLIHSHRCA